MSKTDHLAKARDYIAKGEDYYRKAAEEIRAARDEGMTWDQINTGLGRGEKYAERLVAGVDRGAGAAPFAEPDREPRDIRGAKAMLREAEPETIKRIVREIPREQREHLIDAAHDATVDEVRAQRAEHSTEPTAGELSGGDAFDPAEYWADTLVIRVNRNARELAALIKKAGGLLFGTMPPEEAFDYLHEAERLIAEARAAAQEQVRDRTEV